MSKWFSKDDDKDDDAPAKGGKGETFVQESGLEIPVGEDASDEAVAKYTQHKMASCAEVKTAGYCHKPMAQKGCAATCAHAH